MTNKALISIYLCLIFIISVLIQDDCYGSKYLIQQEQVEAEKAQNKKLYTFILKEMPLSNVFKILSNENINFIYEKIEMQQQPQTQQQQQQQPAQPQQPPQPQLQQQTASIQTTSQSQQLSELENILITLNLKDVTIDEAIEAICKAGDIYCLKVDKNKYIVRRFDVYTIDVGIYFDSYNINMSPGLASINSGSGSGGGGGSSSFQFSENINDLYNNIKQLLSPEGKIIHSKRGLFYIIDKPSCIQKISNFLQKEKQQNAAVKLIVKLVEVTLNDKTSYGLNWNAILQNFSQKIGPFNIGPSTTNIGINTTQDNRGFSFTIDSKRMDMFLKALSEYGDVKIVRDWTVYSRMGLPVILADQESIPYLSEQTIIPSGQNPGAVTQTTTDVKYVDVGIKITIIGNKIKPVSETEEKFEGLIQVLISSLVDMKNLRTGNNPFFAPDIKSSTVIVPLSVKFNEVFLLSGFKVDRLQKTSEGIPVLSKIPILGGLFGYNKKEQSNSEFLILIEPVK